MKYLINELTGVNQLSDTGSFSYPTVTCLLTITSIYILSYTSRKLSLQNTKITTSLIQNGTAEKLFLPNLTSVLTGRRHIHGINNYLENFTNPVQSITYIMCIINLVRGHSVLQIHSLTF